MTTQDRPEVSDTHAASPAIGDQPWLSIARFLTDGSLAALCVQLERLAGKPVWLCDLRGRRIVSTDGPVRWRITDDEQLDPESSDSWTFLPLTAENQTIGFLAVETVDSQLDAGPLDSTLSLLASTVSEFCHNELELEHRIKELGVLYRLNSLLAHAGDVDGVLQIVLDSALDAVGLCAGSIVLLPEDADGVPSGDREDELILKAAHGLSDEWLHSPLPLSKERLFDRLALKGKIVLVPDISADDRVLIPDRAAAEGLGSFVGIGLVFKDQPIGVMRLYDDQVRELSETECRLLCSLAQQAAVSVEQARLLEAHASDQKRQRQLQLAADVQKRMMPRRLPSIEPFSVAARSVPSLDLAGDFYDLFELDGSLGLVVGDVVGKGVAAALLMSAVKASLRAHAERFSCLADVIKHVNLDMCRDTLESEFATLWMGAVDPTTLTMRYCSAGHEPPMLVRPGVGNAAKETDLTELPHGGMIVGVDPSQDYEQRELVLEPGDVLLAYTDGLTDATNFSGEKFGKQRIKQSLINILNLEPDADAARILEHLYWELRQFAGLSARPDDQTAVVLRVEREGH